MGGISRIFGGRNEVPIVRLSDVRLHGQIAVTTLPSSSGLTVRTCRRLLGSPSRLCRRLLGSPSRRAVVFWVQRHDVPSSSGLTVTTCRRLLGSLSRRAVVFWVHRRDAPSSSGSTVTARPTTTVIASVRAVLGRHQNGVVDMVRVDGRSGGR
jgi:hypothetical protein